MGCEIAVGGSASSLAAVRQLFRERDQMFSRFIADSELNTVNAYAGRPVLVSRQFATMVELALEAAAESDGLVDPTLGAALAAAGYDTDFALLPDDGLSSTAGPGGCWSGVRGVDRFVSGPSRIRLYLNGVTKGTTVDDVLELIG